VQLFVTTYLITTLLRLQLSILFLWSLLFFESNTSGFFDKIVR
jgi:hypothetical protein